MICCRSYQDIPDDPRDLRCGPDVEEEEEEDDVETEEKVL